MLVISLKILIGALVALGVAIFFVKEDDTPNS